MCILSVTCYRAIPSPLVHTVHATPPPVRPSVPTISGSPKPLCSSPISEMNEWTGRRQLPNSAPLTNGLSWQLHLLAAEERQGCSRTLAADLYSRSLFRWWRPSLRPCRPKMNSLPPTSQYGKWAFLPKIEQNQWDCGACLCDSKANARVIDFSLWIMCHRPPQSPLNYSCINRRIKEWGEAYEVPK